MKDEQGIVDIIRETVNLLFIRDQQKVKRDTE